MSGDKIPEDHARELADCFADCAASLFGYACVLTRGDRAMAEDLVQLTFLAAAAQWARVRCLCQVQRRSWLRTALGNLAVSAFRRNEAFRDRLPRLEAMYRPPLPDTHTEALQAIALERGWRTIRHLPPQQHAVAAMRWQLGMKCSEIAETRQQLSDHLQQLWQQGIAEWYTLAQRSAVLLLNDILVTHEQTILPERPPEAPAERTVAPHVA